MFCVYTRVKISRETWRKNEVELIVFEGKNELARIKNHIDESIQKSLIDKISKILLGLEIKSNNPIKTKCSKYIVKKILPTL